MTFTTVSIIAGIILLAIFFLIARLAIRWAVRLTIVGVILMALIGVGIFWWWGNRLAERKWEKQIPMTRLTFLSRKWRRSNQAASSGCGLVIGCCRAMSLPSV